jgi:sucrose-6-phosphate hydrolase SacC (GH32 family)
VHNTSGFQKGDNPPICAFRGRDAHTVMSYSLDGAETWTEFVYDPPLKDMADPKVFWHEPSKKWILITFLWPQDQLTMRFLSSPDLKQWKPESTMPYESSECPDMFEMSIDGDPARRKWIFNVGKGVYDIGTFDGTRFTMENERHRLDYGNFYAAQTWANMPSSDGRTLQTAWMQGATHVSNMPFTQQHTFPCELTLQTCREGLRICRTPIREISQLYDKTYEWKDVAIAPGDNPFSQLAGHFWDIDVELDCGTASELGFDIGGHPIRVSIPDKSLRVLDSGAPMTFDKNAVHLRLLVDRTSIEAFVDRGQIALTRWFPPNPNDDTVRMFVKDGSARIISAKIRSLKSMWE